MLGSSTMSGAWLAIRYMVGQKIFFTDEMIWWIVIGMFILQIPRQSEPPATIPNTPRETTTMQCEP